MVTSASTLRDIESKSKVIVAARFARSLIFLSYRNLHVYKINFTLVAVKFVCSKYLEGKVFMVLVSKVTSLLKQSFINKIETIILFRNKDYNF